MTTDNSVLAVRDATIARWDGRLRLFDGGAFDQRSSIAALPAMIAESYAHVPTALLERVTLGLCFFSDVIVGIDDIIDYRQPSDLTRLPRFVVLFSEAHRLFAEAFAHESPFWEHLRRYFIEYLDALDAEHAVATGTLTWAACTEERCLQIARGKNGLVRLVDAAVAALANAPLNGAGDALLQCFVCDQMCDDLRDWEEDVRHRAISLVLRSAWPTMPLETQQKEIAVAIYTQGHAAKTLRIAHTQAERAFAIAQNLNAHALAAFARARVERTRELCEAAVSA